MVRKSLIAAMLVGAMSASGNCLAADALPTSEEIHKAYQDGEYQVTLRDIAHVLPIHGEAGKQYDRYDLYILKAESLLHVKSVSGAAQAFGEAAKIAPDRNAKAIAEATDLLLRKSTGLTYRPRGDAKASKKPSGDAGPAAEAPGIDVIDPEHRKQALAAFYEDESSALAPKLKAAMEGKSLPPILAVVKGAHALHSMEIAAKGGDDATKDLVDKLANHARELLREALRTMDDRVDEIKKAADEEIHYNIPVPDNSPAKYHNEDRVRRRGLDGSQTKELNGYIADCNKVPPAANDLMEALGTDANFFEAEVKKAGAVWKKTNEVLKADYTVNY